MREIIKNLFQGDKTAAITASQGAFVDYIVYLGQELPHELAFESKIPVVHIPLKDGLGSIDAWRLACDIIDKCLQKKVLVACRAGISRSPMMIVCYLLKKQRKPNFNKVFKYVSNLIPEIHPEPNMFSMIKDWAT